MAGKFMNKYRIPSARHPYWDYTSEGAYFITICTADRIHYFGEIENGKMKYTPVGALANVLWFEIKNHNQNVALGEFVVMPNHIHGILILTGRDVARNVSTGTNPSVNERMAQISPHAHSVSVIIRSYKSALTKHCNRLEFDFAWQTRFHDHIIRNQQAFETISNYIIQNPKNWKEDRFHVNT